MFMLCSGAAAERSGTLGHRYHPRPPAPAGLDDTAAGPGVSGAVSAEEVNGPDEHRWPDGRANLKGRSRGNGMANTSCCGHRATHLKKSLFLIKNVTISLKSWQLV